MMRRKIAVGGGGIGGLTFALAAKQLGEDFEVNIFERATKEECLQLNAGGGLGLWPPSMLVMEQLGLKEELEAKGAYMPPPSYRTKSGALLGGPTENFHHRFPILCIERAELLRTLYGACEKRHIPIHTGVTLSSFSLDSSDGFGPVVVKDEEGKTIRNDIDVLVAADGIRSKLRTCLLSDPRSLLRNEKSRQIIEPESCGYTYYRASIPVHDLRNLSAAKDDATTTITHGTPEGEEVTSRAGGNTSTRNVVVAGGSSGSPADNTRTRGGRYHEHAFEAWGDGQRFGYVPMKEPEIFWFTAIPLGTSPGPGSDGAPLSELRGAHTISPEEKSWLLDRFQGWKGPGEIGDLTDLIRKSDHQKILRTDIHKVPNVTKFPWASSCGRVVLLGDAAHATAPNLAQGAGLSIEDAAELAHRLARADIASRAPFVVTTSSQTPVKETDSEVENSISSLEETSRGVHQRSWRQHLQLATSQYEAARKKRAYTVQSMADLVAYAGQQKSGVAASCRDWFMWLGSKVFPTFSQGIFENVVSYSVGGGRNAVTWEPHLSSWLNPSINDSTRDRHYSNIGRLVERRRTATGNDADGNGNINSGVSGGGSGGLAGIPQVGKAFRARPKGGTGKGRVTVTFGDGLTTIRRLFGMPPRMTEEPFEARVEPYITKGGIHKQRWTRRFGPDYYYSTEMQLSTRFADADLLTKALCGKDTPSNYAPKSGISLSEGCGAGFLDKWLAFSYKVTPSPSTLVKYESTGLLLFGLPIILPNFLTPKSVWEEGPLFKELGEEGKGGEDKQEEIGWTFEGTIRLPPLFGGGSLMDYKGFFVPDPPSAEFPAAVTQATKSPGKCSVRLELAATDDNRNVSETLDPVTSTRTTSRGPRHVIVIGATGLLGTELCHTLLDTREKDNNGSGSGSDESYYWDKVIAISRSPSGGETDSSGDQTLSSFNSTSSSPRFSTAVWSGSDQKENVDLLVTLFNQCRELNSGTDGGELVVVNLGGENPGLQRWNKTVMDKIQNSRVEIIKTVKAAVSISPNRVPDAFLQASAVGIYGNTKNSGEGVETAELPAVPVSSSSSASGTDFRISCCKRLEEEAAEVATAAAAISSSSSTTTTKVINLRLGHMLSLKDGAFPWMHLAARCGVRVIGGGGKNSQPIVVPWIHLEDAASAVSRLCQKESRNKLVPLQPITAEAAAAIPVNITAPSRVTQEDMFEAIQKAQEGKRLWRVSFPFKLRIPGSLFKVVAGPSSSVFLDSQDCPPRALVESGVFLEEDFKFSNLNECLRSWECSLPRAK